MYRDDDSTERTYESCSHARGIRLHAKTKKDLMMISAFFKAARPRMAARMARRAMRKR